ncbi:hypothetical protein B9S53_20640 [Arthrospira sp. O9.13F]|nr:hypothetical protein B9S53_20640 [Arthrospira sp. O9.13F]
MYLSSIIVNQKKLVNFPGIVAGFWVGEAVLSKAVALNGNGTNPDANPTGRGRGFSAVKLKKVQIVMRGNGGR